VAAPEQEAVISSREVGKTPHTLPFSVIVAI
jgi:hypothetical protein